MYEPEKILVQNAGIDPGVAALLQNANKGNMDPAALNSNECRQQTVYLSAN